MTHFENIENLLNQVVGMDSMFNRLHNINKAQQTGGYPPYNILKTDDEKYQVEIAVAGFAQDELSIEAKDGQIIVTGEKKAKEEGAPTNYIHRGLANRSFTRQFTLSDDVVVKGADLQNGILFIFLERIVPEEKKPRKIEIGFVSDKQLLTEEA